MKKLFYGFLVLAAVLSGEVAKAEYSRMDGRFYMVIFGYQGPGNRPVDSHTFAAFYEGSRIARGQIQSPATISWLPETGIVRPLRKEMGRNFGLEETIGIAKSRGLEIQAFGPYEISRDFYLHALRQVGILNSGRFEYRMIAQPVSPLARNCIGAVSELNGFLNTGILRGVEASAKVALHFANQVLGYPQMHYDVAQYIGLNYMVSAPSIPGRPRVFR